jgi:acyl-coenzyme A thioesterase PaaI-like protein
MGEGLCGFKGTLHGGALAVLLDETMCSAADNQSRELLLLLFCNV